MADISKVTASDGTTYNIKDIPTRAMIAPDFSTSSTYAIGDHVIYNGELYICKTAISTAGSWTGNTNWTKIILSDTIPRCIRGATFNNVRNLRVGNQYYDIGSVHYGLLVPRGSSYNGVDVYIESMIYDGSNINETGNQGPFINVGSGDALFFFGVYSDQNVTIPTWENALDENRLISRYDYYEIGWLDQIFSGTGEAFTLHEGDVAIGVVEEAGDIRIYPINQAYVTKYDNTTSGLSATDVQAAIDEINTIASGISDKMDKINPTGTGSFSLNRKANTIIGINSFAEGYNCEASGIQSHAEGNHTTASEMQSHAEGNNTLASGRDSHAEGSYTIASGRASHAEGGVYQESSSSYIVDSVTASGVSSHAEGLGTKASSQLQHVFGKYNIEDTSNVYAEIIGNGAHNNSRSNARTLDWNGNETIAGDFYFNGGAQSLSSQLADKANSSALAAVATSGEADDVSYVNTASGLSATDVQGAIDELNSDKMPNYTIGYNLQLYQGELNAINRPIECNGTQFRGGATHSPLNFIDGSGTTASNPNDGDLKIDLNIKTVNGNSLIGSGDITTPDTKPDSFVSAQVPSLTGTDYTAWETDSKLKCPNATTKSIGTIEMQAGYWLLEFAVSFYSNTTGRRGIGLSGTKNASDMGGIINMMMTAPANGGSTVLSKTVLLHPTSTTRYHIIAYQNAGADLYVYPRFRAIRLSH